MPRCKDCGTVYSRQCACCPKCQCPQEDPNPANLADVTTPDSRELFKKWLSIAVGIAVFVGVLIAVYSLCVNWL